MGTDAAATPTRRPGVLEAVVDDEVVLLAEAQAVYHGLDPVGARVWALVDGQRSVADIVDRLVEEFRIDVETCRREVVAFLDDLVVNGLVDVA